jgi:hypothetical protein
MKIKVLVYNPASSLFIPYCYLWLRNEGNNVQYGKLHIIVGTVSQDLRKNVRFCPWFMDFCLTILFNNVIDRDQHQPVQFQHISEYFVKNAK